MSLDPKLLETIAFWQDNYQDWAKNMAPRMGYDLELPRDLARALIGVRRCGKSYLSAQINKRHLSSTCYVNFEDPYFSLNSEVSVLDQIPTAFKQLYGSEAKYLVLDEIQNIKNWEKWVRKIIDAKKYQLIITGSSATLLSSELSSALTGRCLETKVWPLSFREYLKFKPCSTDNYLSELEQYFNDGGFPRVQFGNKDELLRQYLQDIIYKDIVVRHAVRDIAALNTVVQYLLSNISSKHSFSSIKKAFGINVDTAINFANYCESAFLLFSIKKYDRNLKVQSRNPVKVYSIDTGLRQVNAFYHSTDIGKLAENVVFIELKRRGHKLYYHQANYEVDFLVVDGLRPSQAINVCYDNLEKAETYERETQSMLECLEEYNLIEGLVLTKNYEDNVEFDGYKIKFLPLYKFLTKEQ